MSGFHDFITRLKQELDKELPGEDAQYLMAPAARGRKAEMLERDPEPRLSSVLALFYPVDDLPHLVLTLRNEYEGAHSGQVSFPGGRWEEHDVDMKYTALRETEEEIGVPANKIQIVGQLTELYIPPSRFLVYPFIGKLDERPQFQPDPKEVMKIIEASVEELKDDEIIKSKKIKLSSTQEYVTTPYFDVQGHVVWGATAMMISELLEIVRRM